MRFVALPYPYTVLALYGCTRWHYFCIKIYRNTLHLPEQTVCVQWKVAISQQLGTSTWRLKIRERMRNSTYFPLHEENVGKEPQNREDASVGSLWISIEVKVIASNWMVLKRAENSSETQTTILRWREKRKGGSACITVSTTPVMRWMWIKLLADCASNANPNRGRYNQSNSDQASEYSIWRSIDFGRI